MYEVDLRMKVQGAAGGVKKNGTAKPVWEIALCSTKTQRVCFFIARSKNSTKNHRLS